MPSQKSYCQPDAAKWKYGLTAAMAERHREKKLGPVMHCQTF